MVAYQLYVDTSQMLGKPRSVLYIQKADRLFSLAFCHPSFRECSVFAWLSQLDMVSGSGTLLPNVQASFCTSSWCVSFFRCAGLL